MKLLQLRNPNNRIKWQSKMKVEADPKPTEYKANIFHDYGEREKSKQQPQKVHQMLFITCNL